MNQSESYRFFVVENESENEIAVSFLISSKIEKIESFKKGLKNGIEYF